MLYFKDRILHFLDDAILFLEHVWGLIVAQPKFVGSLSLYPGRHLEYLGNLASLLITSLFFNLGQKII